jgi:hypothetical protein
VQPSGVLGRQMNMRRLRGLGLLTLAAIMLVGCGTHSEKSSAKAAGPVIARVSDSKIPYPAASVSGRLSLRDDCLMIGDGVVFWPAGTSWDDAKREVVFGGEFHGSPNARVDATFTGGGGMVALEDDLSRVLSPDAEAALRECTKKTNATHALLAYPEKP